MLPRGVSCIEDLPADLALAIDHGHKILNWQENLMAEEMPPKWMWHLDWELEIWFEEVELARKSKYSGSGDDNLEQVPMMTNDDPELAERFGR